jgi:cbb3-type cytochrome oxidase subunit 3
MSPSRYLRWGAPDPPPPKHPYRDTLLVYGAFAVIVVLIAWATGGDVKKAAVVALVFFLLATAWNTYRLQQRKRAERAERARAQEKQS